MIVYDPFLYSFSPCQCFPFFEQISMLPPPIFPCFLFPCPFSNCRTFSWCAWKGTSINHKLRAIHNRTLDALFCFFLYKNIQTFYTIFRGLVFIFVHLRSLPVRFSVRLFCVRKICKLGLHARGCEHVTSFPVICSTPLFRKCFTHVFCYF